MNLERAAAFLQSHQSFVLAAHQSPDGDTLGSCLALRAALLSMGKDATVVCPDPVPENLGFLSGADSVTGAEGIETPREAVVYVDCADHERTGALKPVLEQAPYQFCIDHHGTNPKGTKDGDWVEEVGATGELILRLLEALEVPVTQEIAVALYTAITTDTGNFAYSNTTPDSLRAAARLLECGVDVPELNRILFRSMRLSKARLIAYVLNNMELLAGGQIAVAAIPDEIMDAYGATKADCEGLIDSLRDIDAVEAACLLRESKDCVRVSMRSKRFCDVAAIGKRFGGGGHQRAAGCTLHMPLCEALFTMKEALISAIS